MRLSRELLAVAAACAALATGPLAGVARAAAAAPQATMEELKTEQRKLEKLLKVANARMADVQWLASRFPVLQADVFGTDREAIMTGILANLRWLRDKRFIGLLKAYASAIDGTAQVTAAEREQLLALALELETTMQELGTVQARRQKVAALLADYVAPSTRRTLLRRAEALEAAARERPRALDELTRAETAYELEVQLCERDPSRSRTRLRELRGQVAIGRKNIERLDARAAVAATLRAAVVDDRLDDSERIRLTSRQGELSRLEHTLEGLSAPAY